MVDAYRILGPSWRGREMTSTSDPRETEGPRFCTPQRTDTSRNIGVGPVCRTSTSCTARSNAVSRVAGRRGGRALATGKGTIENAKAAAPRRATVRMILPIDIVPEGYLVQRHGTPIDRRHVVRWRGRL